MAARAAPDRFDRINRIRATYDTVAANYDAALRDELDSKPYDRAILATIAELSADGRLADVGCGPGHVTRFLAARHTDTIGIDLSPEMIKIARGAAPDLNFEVASMLDLPVGDGAWTGIAALYSIIHFDADDRRAAFTEFARVVRDGGWLLLAFHVDSPDFSVGSTNRITHWFDHDVDLDGHFLDADLVAEDLESAGWNIVVRTLRMPMSGVEYPSRRSYLLAQR